MFKNLKSKRQSNIDCPKPYNVCGTTLTIPYLAPSILELIEASLNGDGLPLTSQPMFDESDEHGIARVMSRSDLSDLKSFADSQSVEDLKSSPDVPNNKEGEGETLETTTTDAIR